MANAGRGTGLRVIFSIFLGLMLTALAGVGVYTFYPPSEEFNTQIRDLRRQEEMIRASRPADQLTDEDRAQIQELNRRRYALEDAREEAQRPWGRTTSIILIAIATLAMAVSLIRAEQLPVISNGLLLGGVFTMLYGVGWIIVTDVSKARFVVMTVALAITLALGYLRFVRSTRRPVEEAEGRPVGPGGPAGPGAPPGDMERGKGASLDAEGLAGLEARLRDLEKRMKEAARALGQGS